MRNGDNADPWADVTAVILAGGIGSRLKPVVSDRPKSLAAVNGRPFLSLLLDQLAAAGTRHVVFSTGYLAEQIQSAFGESYRGMVIGHSRETTPLGTGGGLRLAARPIRSRSLLVLNGDSYCQVDLGAFLRDHVSHGLAPTLVLNWQADPSRFGRVDMDSSGAVLAFHEKAADQPPGWINAGIYAFPQELVEAIPADRAVSLEREIFPAWISRGLRGFPCEGRFLDIGTPESYAQAATFFASLAAAAGSG
jgi:D-glycero-alpha-D-manno-heptose 1-phosphate guanylyltransferase